MLTGTFQAASFLYLSPELCLSFTLALCSAVLCQPWDLILAGVHLSKSRPINPIYHRHTLIKLQKRQDDPWKPFSAELKLELHG